MGLVPLVLAGVVDLAFGVEVTLLARTRSTAEREAWRAAGWDPRDGVAELYGIVEPPPGLRVIVLDRDRLLTPDEAPALRLLPIDRAAGEGVLLSRALWLRAGVAAACLALAVVVLGRLRR